MHYRAVHVSCTPRLPAHTPSTQLTHRHAPTPLTHTHGHCSQSPLRSAGSCTSLYTTSALSQVGPHSVEVKAAAHSAADGSGSSGERRIWYCGFCPSYTLRTACQGRRQGGGRSQSVQGARRRWGEVQWCLGQGRLPYGPCMSPAP